MMFTKLAPQFLRGFDHAEFRQPGIIFFLRHLNCPFARRSLKRFAELQSVIHGQGFSLMFIHMSSDADFRELATTYGLRDFKSISDPDQEYYFAFSIPRARPEDMSTWKVIIRQLMLRYYSTSLQALSGDVNQMDGLVVVHHNVIHQIYRAETLTDFPDLEALLGQAQAIVKM